MAHLFGMTSTSRRPLCAVIGLVVSLLAGAAQAGPRAGDKAPDFSLKTIDKGEARTLASFTKASGMKGAVVVFLSCKCPYVAQARAPLAELAKQYGGKVAFVGLNA